LPILNAGLAQVQKPGDRIVDDALIVDLAGHAPGQIGLDVAAGRDAHFLFCGDAIHSPVQVFWPDWSSGFCLDRVQAAQTRRALLRRAADEDLRLVPGHLRGMTMRVAERNGGFIPLLNN
jgi:glyoxylase-like metal-dependent hydrolase (beta-lactamase superfamily II)